MSRAFAKDDGPDEPPVVAPRAPLPAGAANYVTSRGLRLLREEREALMNERSAADADHSDELERSRRLSVLSARLGMLAERTASARLVEPNPSDTVRFGATVTFTSSAAPEAERRVTIVGVDEADAASGLIAFTAPVARVLTGKKAGDVAELKTASGTERLTVGTVSYDS